jgi:hypothetical protein
MESASMSRAGGMGLVRSLSLMKIAVIPSLAIRLLRLDTGAHGRCTTAKSWPGEVVVHVISDLDRVCEPKRRIQEIFAKRDVEIL